MALIHSLLGQVDPGLLVLLLVSAGFTSLVTASIGAGGGVMLLAIMAQVLPPLVIIPVHGLVQLGSNLGRALMTWRHIDWRVLAAFLPGALVGAFVGSLVLVALPPRLWYLTIAAFILYLCWGPALPKRATGPIGTAIAGALTTFATLFAGATGPLVAAFVKQIHSDRFRTIATFAACMSLQHAAKGVVFEQAGFDLGQWATLIIAMILCGALGTWLGLHVLRRLPEKRFRQVFDGVLTLLALRLIWQACAG